MAFDPAPSTWLAGWSEDGTDLTIPLATFPEITAAEADGTTGDIRKSLFAIMDAIYESWAATATADQPSNMTVRKTSSFTTGATLRRTYSIEFITDISGEEVAAEPA